MAQPTDLDALAIENFKQYLRIPTVHPDIDYTACVEFLQRQADSIGLPVKVVEPVLNKPVVIITWEGTKPELPSIMLNSHMDVVPVYPEQWTYDPFSAHEDEKGNIYARGAQDMKCVGTQYLEAVRRLKLSGVTLIRTVVIVFSPEEEIGKDGMERFLETEDFRKLNVGFELDEGMAWPGGEMIAFYSERSIWQPKVHCPGNPGHGSMMLPGTAGEKLRHIIDKFMDLRKTEENKMVQDPNVWQGDLTTLNMTVVEGGVQANVVPPEFSVVYDIRISREWDLEEFETMLQGWCQEAGSGTYIEFIHKSPKEGTTDVSDSSPWWRAFKKATDKLNLTILPRVCPGSTDARFVRRIGIPAIGISPMNHTPLLLHDHNEYLNKDIFLKGITIYQELVLSLANIPEDMSKV